MNDDSEMVDTNNDELFIGYETRQKFFDFDKVQKSINTPLFAGRRETSPTKIRSTDEKESLAEVNYLRHKSQIFSSPERKKLIQTEKESLMNEIAFIRLNKLQLRLPARFVK